MTPELETERLRLRQWTHDDWQPLASFYGDPDTARHLGGVRGRNYCWLILASEAGHWQLRGYGMWALEQKVDGEFVGFCGPWKPGGWPELELAWGLLKVHHKKGYATEAARAARARIYDELGVTTLASFVQLGNHASHRVAERLGCTNEGVIEMPSGDRVICWRHPSPQQLASETVH